MYLDTSSRLSRIWNRTTVYVGTRASVTFPPSLPDLRALGEKDDVPRDRYRWVAKKLLQGSLLDYMPNICAPPAGSGWGSPAGALAVA